MPERRARTRGVRPLAAYLVAELGQMLAELESMRLEVALIPQRIYTNEGGCVRVAVSVNAPWYRAFCAQHASTRVRRNAAFDTAIRRANTRAALTALLRGERRSKYSGALLALARQRSRRPAMAVTSARAMPLRLYPLVSAA